MVPYITVTLVVLESVSFSFGFLHAKSNPVANYVGL